jgi:hypothetical protein
MAKRRDITEKLSFDENPCLTIKGKDIEVNADAPTVLKAMGIFTSEDTGADDIATIYDLIFPEKSKKKLEALKPSFNDLIIIIEEAIMLITEEETATGEQ